METASPNDSIKRKFMLWKRVDKPNIEQKEIVPKKPVTSSGIVIPQIPKEVWKKDKFIVEEEIAQQNQKLTRRALNNPLVPLGMLATTACLIGMCYTTVKRDRMKTQYFMRGRIAAQFFTFCMLFGGAWYLGSKEMMNMDGRIPN